MNKHLILTSALCLSACGSAPVKTYNRLATLIEVVKLDSQLPQIKLRLTHRQKQERLNPVLSCRFETDSGQFFSFKDMQIPNLKPHISEVITPADLPPLPENHRSQNTLPYQLECLLTSENYSNETITYQSMLHQVPGTQGQYR